MRTSLPLLLVTSLALAACATTSETRTSLDSNVGLSYPDTWQNTTEVLTPNLANPREVVSLGTFVLRPSGPQCAHVLVNALHDLGAGDAFITLQERLDPTDAEAQLFPDRPSSFRSELQGIDVGDAFDCMDQKEREDLGILRWLPFKENGRAFYLLVAIGRDATPARLEETVEILDSMAISHT